MIKPVVVQISIEHEGKALAAFNMSGPLCGLKIFGMGAEHTMGFPFSGPEILIRIKGSVIRTTEEDAIDAFVSGAGRENP